MRILFLGCGTSTGVPVIGCKCQVCSSNDPKNWRLRASLFIQHKGKNLLIDTSTDLRLQALRHSITRIDAVLYTHPHADHLHGIDELRVFNLLQTETIPCYGNEETIGRIRRMFHYIFEDCQEDGWKPKLEACVINGPFSLGDITIQPIEVYHGKMKVLSFRIDKMAYVTDCNHIPEDALNGLKGLDLLILDALRHKPHKTHFNIDGALRVVRELKPSRAVLTHLSHNLDYHSTNRLLPPEVELAYDGMEIILP